MNKKQIVDAQITLYKSVHDHTIDFVKAYICDTTQPAKDRWAAYISLTSNRYKLDCPALRDLAVQIDHCCSCNQVEDKDAMLSLSEEKQATRFCSPECKQQYIKARELQTHL